MAKFIQRNPCQPKPIWWKKYQNNLSLGKRVIYVATPSLGFEVSGYPQALISIVLSNGTGHIVGDVEYIPITSISTENDTQTITPTKAIKFQGNFYMFNPETNLMEEQDIVDEDVEIISAYASEMMKIEKNIYVKKYPFDCNKEDDQESSSYQPIQGLLTETGYLSIRTGNFSDTPDKPAKGDLIHYQKRFWIVEEARESSTYRPREIKTLHLTLKKIKR